MTRKMVQLRQKVQHEQQSDSMNDFQLLKVRPTEIRKVIRIGIRVLRVLFSALIHR